MKLISLAAAACIALCSVAAIAQTATPPPQDGSLRTDSSIRCSGGYCYVTTVVYMYVGTYPNGVWIGVSEHTTRIKQPTMRE
jgi:hypothetical protein